MINKSWRDGFTQDERRAFARGAQKAEAVAAANRENAWAALRMIRQAVEELGPVGALVSEEAVLQLYGPEPVHEAQAIIEGIQKLCAQRRTVGIIGKSVTSLFIRAKRIRSLVKWWLAQQMGKWCLKP